MFFNGGIGQLENIPVIRKPAATSPMERASPGRSRTSRSGGTHTRSPYLLPSRSNYDPGVRAMAQMYGVLVSKIHQHITFAVPGGQTDGSPPISSKLPQRGMTQNVHHHHLPPREWYVQCIEITQHPHRHTHTGLPSKLPGTMSWGFENTNFKIC